MLHLNPGDTVTFAGEYQHPRWWQLRKLYRYYIRGKRPLQPFVITWSSI